MKTFPLASRWLGVASACVLASASMPTRSNVLGADSGRLPLRRTSVSIVSDQFYINGKLTYEGRKWNGQWIQGLLMNARLVQGTFDDRNQATASRWVYPDTRRWDPERNTREFLAAMPEWRRHGLLAFTLNLQGGSPEGYSKEQPWHNSAIESDGSLRPDYIARVERILNRADELGMVVILGYFYFGQDQRLKDESAVLRAVDLATDWLLTRGYRNVLVEINNECNVNYDHAILRPERVHELVERVQGRSIRGRRLYAGTSYGGGTVPRENVVRVSDFLLLHGNGINEPRRLAEMVRQTREVPGYFAKPILVNEDDHFDFDQPSNNCVAAVGAYASWGFFDPGKNNYRDGYQSPPVDWGINTVRKRQFFSLVAQMTGTAVPESPAIQLRQQAPMTPVPQAVQVESISHRGWSNAFRLRNGQAEAVVVPSIGRIMQFGFQGEPGAFWENAALTGRGTDASAPEWINFGGDKAWPSPEGDWAKVIGQKSWRPPLAFDGQSHQAHIDGTAVVLTSAVDRNYGIRVTRRIQLDANLPLMTVTTSFEKVVGEPVTAGIWVVTQLGEPDGVVIPVPEPSLFGKGFTALGTVPPSLERRGDLLVLTRDRRAAHKIGTDAGTLVWVGPKVTVRIDSPRQKGALYPDYGSSAEVYTNPDMLTYIELEMLGPVREMRVGDRAERTNVYSLHRRGKTNIESEARRVLSLAVPAGR